MRLIQTPRKRPLPVPMVGVFDEPYKLILVNREWWSHVSGMIDVLSSLDAWVGDIDEKTRGIREIAKLLSTDWNETMIEDIQWVLEEPPDEFGYSYYKLQKSVGGAWLDVAGSSDVGSWWRDTAHLANDAWAFAYAIRNIEDFDSWYSGDFQGWNPSPLKAYIDPALINASDALYIGNEAAAAAAAAQVTANLAQSSADNANASAAAAQLTADNGLNQALAAQATNTFQGGQISAIQTRLNALEYGGVWNWLHNFSVSQQGYILGTEGSYSAGIGFRSNSNGLEIVYNAEQIKQNQIEWLQCEVLYNSSPTGNSLWRVNGRDNALFQYSGVGVSSFGWYQLPPSDYANLTIEFAGSGDFYLLSMRYLGKGNVLPFD